MTQVIAEEVVPQLATEVVKVVVLWNVPAVVLLLVRGQLHQLAEQVAPVVVPVDVAQHVQEIAATVAALIVLEAALRPAALLVPEVVAVDAVLTAQEVVQVHQKQVVILVPILAGRLVR